MPSTLHPQAKFDPIPPDLDLSALVEKTPNFDYVVRIGADHIHELGFEQFEKLVLLHVINGGKPLVIEGWHKDLPSWLFSHNWLEENVGKKQENVRDIMNSSDIPMTIGHYLGAMDKLQRQWTSANYRDPKRQRLYLKDIDCPEPWHQFLKNVIPQTLFYLNDCIGEPGDPGASCERNSYNQLVLGKGFGVAGDLMSNLPPEMRAQNMMCYIGHEGTYTPAHREMCASLGQNIMVETSKSEDGENTGSSIWFMTESKDREVVSEYFLSMLGHDIEVESHFAQINAWKKAPFPVYLVNQRAGDFILIPPLAPHQVWNRGTRTMKVAWNRTTVETLELALHEALPRARMVCRDEQYKNKAIIYFSLLRYYDQLKRVEQVEDACWDGHVKDSISNATRVRQLRRDFKRLFTLFMEILLSEMFSKDLPIEKHVEFLPFDSNVTCSYCRCNIFNRFLTCKTCVGEVEGSGDDDTYDVCMECYAMGRSCGCVSNLVWVEQWKWPELVGKYDEWRAMVITNDGVVDSDSPPQNLDVVRSLSRRKPVAQICQEQLKRRPWRDISKPFKPELSLESEPEQDVDDEGVVKKRRGSKRKSRKTQNKTCHICRKGELNWKLAFCTTCPNSYCYGTLWRAFDLKPQTVMEDPNWQCPECLKVCSCGKCRRDANQQAYQPKGTLLGHDTKRVADPRSVESLVDFSRTNLTWLRGEGDYDPQTSLRMQRLMEKAQTEKAREESLDEDDFVDRDARAKKEQNSLSINLTNDMAIDPQLRDQESYMVNNIHNLDDSHLGVESTMIQSPMAHQMGHHGAISGASHHVDVNSPPVPQGPYRRKASPAPADYPHYTSVEANILDPKSAILDPWGPGRDRMMGMGYYQQANDDDRILFDHPDAITRVEQESIIRYPRLVEETLNIHTDSQKQGSDNDMDDAHTQSFQTQKRQKLSDTRRKGKYDTTLKQLKGGQRYIVKLPMKGSKEFLRNLQDLDERRTSLRRNHRTPRGSLPRQPRLSKSNGSIVMITTDTQGRVDQNIYQNDSEDEDASPVLAPEAVKIASFSSIQPKAAVVEKSKTDAKKRGRPPKVSSTHKDRSSNNEDPSHVAHATLSMIEKSVGNNSAPTISQKGTNDCQQPSPSSPGHIKISQQSKPLEVNVHSELLPIEPPDSPEIPRLAIMTNEEPTKELVSATIGSRDKDVDTITDEAWPVIKAPDTSKASPPRTNTRKLLSEDYLKAKEEAYRMAEAALENEGSSRAQTHKSTDEASIISPKKVVNPLAKNTLPKSITKSLSTGPPRKFMSMAERQALKGKPFKVVTAKSTHSRGTPTMTSGTKCKSTTLPHNLRYSFGVDSPGGDNPCSSSDESIPAVRPAVRKPRIEALGGSTGNTKASFTPILGIRNGARKGKVSVNFFK